jgi:23S rRNA pseudouridine955/2504/2580 synthase
VAKNKAAAAVYSKLLGRRDGVVKQYLAICKGRPQKAEGIIDLDLGIEAGGPAKKAQAALTRYRQLNALSLGPDGFSLFELELGTGRMHQIRRHLAMLGNPVIGDGKYGDFSLNHALRKSIKLQKLLLHASRLVIPETQYNPRLDLSAPLPGHFLSFIGQCSEP